ncbi:endonuclease NucS domain-containing protein [Halobaculum sp. P14]|uniref:endonuclease NucS domain-containing protein n=1 Tax=Halobaculum sp. P14 TaxID=3421638 RepID=UPI003EBCFEE9
MTEGDDVTYPVASTAGFESVADRITAARVRGERVLLTAECETEYDGKAVAELTAGDRDVIVKQDGGLTVHAPTGTKPQNWLGSGATLSTRVVAGAEHPGDNDEPRLLLRGRDGSGGSVDELDVYVSTVYHLDARRLADHGAKDISGVEADLKAALLADPDDIEPGFRVEEDEYDTGAGPVDIVGRDADGTRTLVELKQRAIDPEAVHQLRRYCEADTPDGATDSVRGIVVGPGISDDAAALADDYGYDFVERDPPRQISRDTATLDEFL